MRRKITTVIAGLLLASFSSKAQFDPKIRFNGFGDLIAAMPFNKVANDGASQLFKQYGDEYYPYDVHSGLKIHGLDMLTTIQLDENIKFQTEINIDGGRSKHASMFDIYVDRMYLDYKFTDYVGFQLGLIYTPIGYINRNLYSRAWLMNSVHFYPAVEQWTGLIQSHFAGITEYGTLALPKGNCINYTFGVGMPKGATPNEQIYFGGQLGYQFTALLEWKAFIKESELHVGLSGYTDKIYTYYIQNLGDEINVDDTGLSKLQLQEVGFNPYVLFKSKFADILCEYATVNTHVLRGDYPNKDLNLSFLSAEVAFNRKLKGKRLAPYLRYEYVKVPEGGGPYYGLRIEDETIKRTYSPNFEAMMVGVAYDLASFNRIKLEYMHNFDGPFASDCIFFQTAFGF